MYTSSRNSLFRNTNRFIRVRCVMLLVGIRSTKALGSLRNRPRRCRLRRPYFSARNRRLFHFLCAFRRCGETDPISSSSSELRLRVSNGRTVENRARTSSRLDCRKNCTKTAKPASGGKQDLERTNVPRVSLNRRSFRSPCSRRFV